MSIDFSIIIPTLNSEKYLFETINSIIKQNRSIKIQLIFCDGGSKDSTFKIIESFKQKNILKKIIYNQYGLSRAINIGLSYARGKYCAYLNSDDFLNDNVLLLIKNKFEMNKRNQWIIGLCENIGEKYTINKLVNFYKKFLLKNLSFNLLCINNIISQPSVFWRKSFFEDIGKFDENLRYNMDYDMWLRMLKISKPYILNFKISSFRRHSSSLSHKNTFSQFKEKYKTMRKYKDNIIINLLHIIISSLALFIYKLTNY